MYEKPEFSVVIPTFNREKLLKRAIDSILNQTYKNFELIVVDDGSEDHTKEMIKGYTDDRLIYVYKENGGQNSALNVGIGRARGKYIGFCDSDDSWFPNKLEEHILKYNSDSEIKVVYDLTGVIKNGEVVLGRDDTCEGWCYKEVLEQGYLTSPTFLTCDKSCFEKIGMLPEDLINCQDDDLCFKLCKYYKVGLIKKILGILHTDATNRITSWKKRCAEDYFKLWNIYSDDVINICGMETLKRKYFKAANNFIFIDEADKAKDVFLLLQKFIGRSIKEIVKQIIQEHLNYTKKVILYGAGERARKLYKMLTYYELDLEYIVVVTNLDYNANDFFNIKIKSIYEISRKQYFKLPIIISSNTNFYEMKKRAEDMGFLKIISAEEILNITL